jgi:hypothetical protein
VLVEGEDLRVEVEEEEEGSEGIWEEGTWEVGEGVEVAQEVKSGRELQLEYFVIYIYIYSIDIYIYIIERERERKRRRETESI